MFGGVPTCGVARVRHDRLHPSANDGPDFVGGVGEMIFLSLAGDTEELGILFFAGQRFFHVKHWSNHFFMEVASIRRQISLEVRASFMKNCEQLQSTLTAQ
ncbi:unnamed protein product [Caenorhabditis nigoni]